jgi:histidinol-phosphate phosphatase family protein
LKKIPTIFIDRDGTLIKQIDELVSPTQLKLLPGAAEAVAYFKKKKFLVIGLTNQPIIEKGLLNQKGLREIHRALQEMVTVQSGSALDAIYTCPHRYRAKGQCSCRKPGLGLIRRAQARFSIDMTKSWLIGDRLRDVETGKRAGIKTILVKTGGKSDDDKFFSSTKPEHIAKDLKAATKFIK